jgi:hypothetical protein
MPTCNDCNSAKLIEPVEGAAYLECRARPPFADNANRAVWPRVPLTGWCAEHDPTTTSAKPRRPKPKRPIRVPVAFTDAAPI